MAAYTWKVLDVTVTGDNLPTGGQKLIDNWAVVSSTLTIDATTFDLTLPNALTVTGLLSSGNAAITGGTISGITDLSIADGGTGSSTAPTARTALGVDAAGTDNSTNVTLAGTPNYLTIVGQVITRVLVNLTSHVTGVLPILNGGTNASTTSAARTNLGVDVAGTDNSTNVTLTGTPNYLTIVGQVITRALVNLTSHVTGVLPLLNGGTGSATLTSGEVAQVENINTVTISNAQWAFLGAFNQGLTTTSNVSFGTITGSGNLTVNSGKLFVSLPNPDVSAFTMTATTGTNAAGLGFVNTGSRAFMGMDNSAGNRFLASGSLGTYQMVITTETSGTPIILGTGNKGAVRINGTDQSVEFISVVDSVGTSSGSVITTGGVGAAKNIIGGALIKSGAGTTASRPTPRGAGSMWFDTTLGKPIWHDGTNWVDAAGTIV